jgi:hypothetical protein
VLKVLPYISWFPYDSIRKVVYIAGRQHTRQAGGDLVYITQLPHQIQNNTTHIAQDVRLRSQQPSQQLVSRHAADHVLLLPGKKALSGTF